MISLTSGMFVVGGSAVVVNTWDRKECQSDQQQMVDKTIFIWNTNHVTGFGLNENRERARFTFDAVTFCSVSKNNTWNYAEMLNWNWKSRREWWPFFVAWCFCSRKYKITPNENKEDTAARLHCSCSLLCTVWHLLWFLPSRTQFFTRWLDSFRKFHCACIGYVIYRSVCFCMGGSESFSSKAILLSPWLLLTVLLIWILRAFTFL